LTTSPKNKIQEALLDRYIDAIKWFGQAPDVVLHVGDGTDGKDPKGGDVDEDCMLKQAEDCAKLIVLQKPKKEVILVTGTRYHDSHHGQEFIEHCAKCIKYDMLKQHKRAIEVSIRRKLKTTINGWFRLEARHCIGGSSIPHGRATAALRAQMWNVLNSALDSQINGGAAGYPHLLTFAHRHNYIDASNAWGTVMILPCWQALGGIYGDEQCDGHVDLGLVKLTVGNKEANGWQFQKRLYLAGVVGRTEAR